MHREKVTRVMKDWSDLEEKYQEAKDFLSAANISGAAMVNHTYLIQKLYLHSNIQLVLSDTTSLSATQPRLIINHAL